MSGSPYLARRRGMVFSLVAVLVAGLLLAVSGSPAHAADSLLSQGHTVTASSTQNASFPASAAFDGDTGTRWSSAAGDPQWVRVDLGSSRALCGAQLDLQPGAGTTVSFPVTSHDLAYWPTAGNGWTTAPGAYRTLPLTGTLTVSGTAGTRAAVTVGDVSARAGSAGGSVTLTNPHGMSSAVHAAVTLPVTGRTTAPHASLTFTATGLPPGLMISRSGAISGAARSRGGPTVTVTATDGTGAADTVSFVWTVT